MRYLRLCKTHPTYKARKPPTGNCAECRRAYDAERKKYAIVHRAARQLSRLFGVEVSVEAKFRRATGSPAGVFVASVPTNTPDYDGTLPTPDGSRVPAGRVRKRIGRATTTAQL